MLQTFAFDETTPTSCNQMSVATMAETDHLDVGKKIMSQFRNSDLQLTSRTLLFLHHGLVKISCSRRIIFVGAILHPFSAAC